MVLKHLLIIYFRKDLASGGGSEEFPGCEGQIRPHILRKKEEGRGGGG